MLVVGGEGEWEGNQKNDKATEPPLVRGELQPVWTQASGRF